MKLGRIKDMPNSEYHAQHEAKDHFYSSSQLKDMLEDPEIFYRKYITGEIERETNPAFDIGTYFHTSILEPEKLEEECAIWTGATRRGKAWDKFQEIHEGKAIITMKDKIKVDNLINATKASPRSMELIYDELAVAEDSFFVELMGVKVKVRTDVLRLGQDFSYILDLKSTTGNCKNEHKIRNKVGAYSYDLSAAIYVDAINAWIKETKQNVAPITAFYWTFASKDYAHAMTWLASEKNMAVGRAKYQKALRLIKGYTENNWHFEDTVGVVEPQPWDVTDWLDVDKPNTNKGSAFGGQQKNVLKPINGADLL